MSIGRTAAVALLCAAAPSLGAAQAVTVAAGARMYDAGGAPAAMLAVRTEFPMGAAAVLEFASAIAEQPADADAGVASVFEAQVQLPVALGQVLTPYFGAGLGMASTSRPGEASGWKMAPSLSAGVRAALGGQLGLVLDARARGIGAGFDHGHLDVTAGLRYLLPPR